MPMTATPVKASGVEGEVGGGAGEVGGGGGDVPVGTVTLAVHVRVTTPGS